MGTFEIKDRFYLNGRPFQIISGGIHYFRVLPEYWEDRLLKLKALGCNTVETYIPWNLHEPVKGKFDFYGEKLHGMLDVAAFVRLAQKCGLWVILRPSPYICAEWDFGGLPAWLLAEDGMELRTSDERYLRHVRDYYAALLPVLAPLQIDRGGPVLMMQVENEYGSFGNDTAYLESMRDRMREGGITVPLFASDGPENNMLSNTHVEGVFPTANFGSGAKEAFRVLRKYNGDGPCMCTEFWLGWFDAWKNPKHLTGNMEEAVSELGDILEEGNVNLYMFEGGTNFGFMNGANYGDHLTVDVTSYDYGALLTEDGQITEKYRQFAEVIRRKREKAEACGPEARGEAAGDSPEAYREAAGDILAAGGEEREAAPADGGSPVESAGGEAESLPGRHSREYGRLSVADRTGLFEALPDLASPVETVCPRSMERLGQSYGYILYRTQLRTEKQLRSIRFYDAADRAIVFADGERILTAEDKELSERYAFEEIEGDHIRLDVLMENMGRVNYGPMLNWQRKGIDGCVVINDRFSQHGWQQYCLPLDNLERLDYTKGYAEGKPAFYRFWLDVEETGTEAEDQAALLPDTFLDFTGWGKGCVFVNGFNLGRFWEVGPQKRLYLPGALLKPGRNEIVLFETEGKHTDSIVLRAEPDLGPTD